MHRMLLLPVLILVKANFNGPICFTEACEAQRLPVQIFQTRNKDFQEKEIIPNPYLVKQIQGTSHIYYILSGL